jgi:hypothetical protein
MPLLNPRPSALSQVRVHPKTTVQLGFPVLYEEPSQDRRCIGKVKKMGELLR